MGASAFCVVAAVKSSNSSLLLANSSLKKGVDSAIQLRDLVDGDKGSSETAVEEANIRPQLTLLVGHLWTLLLLSKSLCSDLLFTYIGVG